MMEDRDLRGVMATQHNADELTSMAVSMRDQGRIDEALDFYDQALKLNQPLLCTDKQGGGTFASQALQ
jgi:tetratricopeptide (TPR) repeat protein